jgi:hypothetical protein
LGPAALVYIDRFTDTTLKYTGTYIYTIYISTRAGKGFLDVPTPWKCTSPVVGESRSGDEIQDAGGGSGSDRCDGNVGLEDDDVSIIPCGKKRIAARVITSDSEDEEKNGKDGKVQEVTPSRKRLLRGIGDSSSDNEDDAEDVRMVSLKHVSVVAEEETGHEEDYKDDNISIREVI